MTKSARRTSVSDAPGATVAGAVEALAADVASLTWETVPEEVRRRTLLVLYDTAGVMVAGATTPEVEALAGRHTEPGPTPLVGLGRRTTAESSCWVNGYALCSLELDEGSKYARGHPAAHVVPAALASATGHTGAVWLAAVLAGYEVAARFGAATRLHPGVHPHGTWGATGSAAAAARLSGLDAPGIAAAVDTACGLALAPHFDSAIGGNPVRNLWVGHSGVAGIEAARLAASGWGTATGTARATLGGILGAFDPAPLTVPLRHRFEIMHGYFKRHAACAFTHSAADAALGVRAGTALDPADIEAITVETYRSAAALDGLDWPTRLAAMFSVPYVVAVTILDGGFGPSATDAVRRDDPTVHRLARLVRVVPTAEFEDRLPHRRGARITVGTGDGGRLVHEVEQPVGDSAHHPFGWADIRDKLVGLIGAPRARRLESAVLRLPHTDVAAFLDELERT